MSERQQNMRRDGRDGFTLVEVVIALVILAVGLLALASTSIFSTTQIRVADLKTEESLAVQQVAERLQALPFDSVKTVAKGSGQTVGAYQLWWSVSNTGTNLRDVRIYTQGLGYKNGKGWSPTVQDTFAIQIARRDY